MAVLSNIKKYTIRHSFEAEGTEVEIPVYPTSVMDGDNLISKSWNNMYGEFNDIPINIKVKVNWIFDTMSDEDGQKLYGEMIRAKEIKYNNRFFVINTYFPGVGWISGTFYLGTPTNFTSKGAGYDNGQVPYWSGELHWIEVKGIRLNSPTSVVPDVEV